MENSLFCKIWEFTGGVYLDEKLLIEFDEIPEKSVYWVPVNGARAIQSYFCEVQKYDLSITVT